MVNDPRIAVYREQHPRLIGYVGQRVRDESAVADICQQVCLSCLPRRAPNYRLLNAYAALGLPSAAHGLLTQRAADEQRIRRLRFLKQNLYDHPDLLVLDAGGNRRRWS
ncbi:hypothetical protein [Streptomyces sp. NPDC093970]|uniref:hypothetical protein n=1 Tax=Streptomyces sp. NPDC093970 TaxID=3155076 RepID=UPI0034202FD5